MAGGDEVGVELLAVGPELAELEPVVADDARVRRAAREVLVGEVVDDAVEVVLEVEGVERDVEPVGDAAGIAGVDGAAAALLVVGRSRRRSSRLMDAGAHEQADDVVALLLEQVRGDGAVHSATHRQHDARSHTNIVSSSLRRSDCTSWRTLNGK